MTLLDSGNMGKHRRPRIMFICDEAIKETLEKRAAAEHRTVSNLVEMIVVEELRRNSHSEPATSTTPTTTEKTPAFNATTLLRRLLEPLSDTDIIILSHDYDLDPKLLIELRDRLIPRQKNGNGHEINR